MIYYFTLKGEPFTGNTVTGEDAVAKGNAIKIDNVPDGIESWRLSIDPATRAVTVFGGVERDEAAAQALKEEERIARAAAENAARAQLLANPSSE